MIIFSPTKISVGLRGFVFLSQDLDCKKKKGSQSEREFCVSVPSTPATGHVGKSCASRRTIVISLAD